MGDKVYVITRKDLKYGDQACQGIHAAFEFAAKYPELTKNWIENSNYLVFLNVENEDELKKLIIKVQQKEIKYSITTEPDLNNEITSLVLEPNENNKKICSSIPLALKNNEIYSKCVSEYDKKWNKYFSNKWKENYRSMSFIEKLKFLFR